MFIFSIRNVKHELTLLNGSFYMWQSNLFLIFSPKYQVFTCLPVCNISRYYVCLLLYNEWKCYYQSVSLYIIINHSIHTLIFSLPHSFPVTLWWFLSEHWIDADSMVIWLLRTMLFHVLLACELLSILKRFSWFIFFSYKFTLVSP